MTAPRQIRGAGAALGPFAVTKLGWFMYRAYYYLYWDTTLKALM